MIQIRRFSAYNQGQTFNKIREYFYYVDHNGQLFLDDARMKNFTSCFKDLKFLTLFFKRLKPNMTDRYRDFPHVYVCASELNYVRSQDLPLVFTSLLEDEATAKCGTADLSLNNTQNRVTFPFEPSDLYIDPGSGRVYHPAPANGGGVGLIKSALAQALSPNFIFPKGACIVPNDILGADERRPSGIVWKGVSYQLSNLLAPIVKAQSKYKSENVRYH